MHETNNECILIQVSITRAIKDIFQLTHLKVKHKSKSLCVCVCVCLFYNLNCNFWTTGFIFMEDGTDFNPYALLLTVYNR